VRRPSKRSQHDTQGLWRVGGHRNRLDPSYRNSKRRQQRGEPAGVQGALGFVESRPGDPVAFGDFADTDSVDPVTPHHLVPSLEQIVRIEERIAARHASSLPADLVCLAIEGCCATGLHPRCNWASRARMQNSQLSAAPSWRSANLFSAFSRRWNAACSSAKM
jgi:hypothetical protein